MLNTKKRKMFNFYEVKAYYFDYVGITIDANVMQKFASLTIFFFFNSYDELEYCVRS